MDRLRKVLGADTAEAFAARVVPALRRAYEVNLERYRPELGDDDLFFGVAVWRNATHLLGVECADLPGSTVEESSAFQMTLGGRTFRVYKMPPRLGDNIAGFALDGSKIRVAQGEANDAQLTLFSPSSFSPVADVGEPEFSRLVVVHQGTPEDGLRWVEVGAPSRPSDRTWHWHERIYDAGWGLAALPGDVQPPVAPTAPALDVRIKPELLQRLQRDKS